jgi:hypothetical protein
MGGAVFALVLLLETGLNAYTAAAVVVTTALSALSRAWFPRR